MAHTLHWRLILVAAIASLAGSLATTPASADDSTSEGITVSGNGTVKGKPAVIEFEVTVSGEGELADDARVKYQDIKKKGLAALDALKNPDLSVESGGPAVSQATNPQMQMRMMQGMPPDTTKQKIEISEKLNIQLKGIDKLPPDKLLETVLKLIDTCHDAGLDVGPPGATNYYQMQMRAQTGAPDTLVSFKIPDKTELENQAYEKAVADAKAKAERIATLTGVKLGPVSSVKDQGTSGGESNGPRPYFVEMYMGGSSASGNDADNKDVSSNAPGDIPVSAHLIVTFQILK